MEFSEKLASEIKPELNNIYTEEPFSLPGGIDIGWFCREHAFHLYLVAQLLDYKACIVTGDFLVIYPGKGRITSAGTNFDHAWCKIDQAVPVDLSMTLKYIYPSHQDLRIVYGKAYPETFFRTAYLTDQPAHRVLELAQTEEPLVLYNQNNILHPNPIDLLKDPYSFLYPPPPGKRTFTEVYGPDAFSRITYHCYKLAMGLARPFFTYRDTKSSLAAILKFNEHAHDELIKLFLGSQ